MWHQKMLWMCLITHKHSFISFCPFILPSFLSFFYLLLLFFSFFSWSAESELVRKVCLRIMKYPFDWEFLASLSKLKLNGKTLIMIELMNGFGDIDGQESCLCRCFLKKFKILDLTLFMHLITTLWFIFHRKCCRGIDRLNERHFHN